MRPVSSSVWVSEFQASSHKWPFSREWRRDLALRIKRASHTLATLIEDVRVNHRRLDIFVTQQFPHSANIAIATLLRTFLVVCFACCQKCPCPNLCGGSYIIASLEQMSGKTMSKRMTADSFVNPCCEYESVRIEASILTLSVRSPLSDFELPICDKCLPNVCRWYCYRHSDGWWSPDCLCHRSPKTELLLATQSVEFAPLLLKWLVQDDSEMGETVPCNRLKIDKNKDK